MALAATNLATAGDNIDKTSPATFATASISPAANSLLLVGVHLAATTTAGTPTVSGLGLTWTEVVFDADGVRSQAVWRAQCGASPGSGALALGWSAGDAIQTGGLWSVIQVTGHNPTTPIVQFKVGGGDGTTATAPTATLDGAIGAAGNRVINFVSHRNQNPTTPRTNWTELGDAVTATNPSEAIESQWRNDGTNETTFGASWTTTARYQMMALELAIASVAAGGRPKIWSGSAWVQKPGKIWSGSAWVEKPVKRWNGSAWITLT